MGNKKFLSSMIAFSCVYSSMFAADKANDESVCQTAPNPIRVSVRHIEPNGIGYNQGYTSFDIFLSPTNLNSDFIPFLDARAHVFDNGKPACNAGGGLRYIQNNLIYGINAYYDYRSTNRYHYNQVGAGLELMYKTFDLRWNGYLPVGAKASSLYETSFYEFKNDYAYTKSKQEFVMKGMNLEGGWHFYKDKHAECYMAIGPYYFEKFARNAIGGQVRLSATLFNMIKIDANASYDRVFKGIGQGQIGLVFPLGKKVKVKPRPNLDCKSSNYIFDRSFQSVDRFEIIVADKRQTENPIINPVTNKPYTFTFLSGNSTSTPAVMNSSLGAVTLGGTNNSGISTYKSDVIIVSGNYTPIAPIFIADQLLTGDSTPIRLAVSKSKSILIPALYTSTQAPTISGNSSFTGPIVTMGKNSTVTGLSFIGTGQESAILASGVASTIKNIKFSGNYTTNVINGENPTSIIIKDCIFEIGTKSAPLEAVVFVESSAPQSIVVIDNNQFYIQAPTGTSKAIFVNGLDSAVIDAKIRDNAIGCNTNTNFCGIEVQSQDTSKVKAKIINNKIELFSPTFSSLYGIQAQTSTNVTNQGTLLCNIKRNVVSLNAEGTTEGITINSSSSNPVSGIIQKNLVSSSSTGGSTHKARGIYLELEGSESNWLLQNNTLITAGSAISEGILVAGGPGSAILNGVYNVDMIKNKVSATSSLAYSGSVTGGAYGINCAASTGANLTYKVLGNKIVAHTLAPTSGTPSYAYGVQAQVFNSVTPSSADIIGNIIEVTAATGATKAFGIQVANFSGVSGITNFTGTVSYNIGSVSGATTNNGVQIYSDIAPGSFTESNNNIQTN